MSFTLVQLSVSACDKPQSAGGGQLLEPFNSVCCFSLCVFQAICARRWLTPACLALTSANTTPSVFLSVRATGEYGRTLYIADKHDLTDTRAVVTVLSYKLCFCSGGFVRCECLPGYVGQHCEQDYNDCMENKCQHGAECVDAINGYTCVCKEGFR